MKKYIQVIIKSTNDLPSKYGRYHTKQSQSKPEPPKEIKSAEEYYESEIWRFDFGKKDKAGFIEARELDIIRFANEYHAQFTTQRQEISNEMIAIEILARFHGNSRGLPIAKKNFIDGAKWAIEQDRGIAQRQVTDEEPERSSSEPVKSAEEIKFTQTPAEYFESRNGGKSAEKMMEDGELLTPTYTLTMISEYILDCCEFGKEPEQSSLEELDRVFEERDDPGIIRAALIDYEIYNGETLCHAENRVDGYLSKIKIQ